MPSPTYRYPLSFCLRDSRLAPSALPLWEILQSVISKQSRDYVAPESFAPSVSLRGYFQLASPDYLKLK